MILRFITKRDINGNSYFLQMDTEKKIFTRVKQRILYTREDATQTTKTAIRKLVEQIKTEGYTEVDYM